MTKHHHHNGSSNNKNNGNHGDDAIPGPGSLLVPLLLVTETTTNTADWTVEEFAEYFHQRATDMGGDYSDLFRAQKIDGSVYQRLTEDDLKEMGVESVGDRLRILQELEAVAQLQERHDRDKVYWKGTEERYGNQCDRCRKTYGGCCPGDDPTEYQVTGIQLQTFAVEQERCGPIPLCCCGAPRFVDHTIDLVTVKDATVVVIPPDSCGQDHCRCCCPATQEQVYVKTMYNKVMILKLPREEGETVARRILCQAKALQPMERA